MFRRKKKISNLGQIGIKNPLEVVPVVEPGVEARRDRGGLLQIRRVMELKEGLYRWISKKLGFRHDIRVNLDEEGSYFWKQINDHRTLEDIAEKLQKKFDLKKENARGSVITFTKFLLLRRLVYLKVPLPPETQKKVKRAKHG